jgi:hypothetical protein
VFRRASDQLEAVAREQDRLELDALLDEAGTMLGAALRLPQRDCTRWLENQISKTTLSSPPSFSDAAARLRSCVVDVRATYRREGRNCTRELLAVCVDGGVPRTPLHRTPIDWSRLPEDVRAAFIAHADEPFTVSLYATPG